MHKIGILSDTHGLLRPEVIWALQGCEAILHGGDINRQDIIDQLNTIAPVYVVRGNNDKDWAEHIPMFLDLQLYGCRIYMTHKKKDIPSDVDADVVIYGHSHKYVQDYIDGTLYLNPGSCGPRRFNQAITMAVLTVPEDGLSKDNSAGGSSAMKSYGITVERIDIPHAAKTTSTSEVVCSRQVTADLIIKIGSDLEKHRTVADIAARRNISMELTEQIVRLYVTHPGVTAEQIMSKMGL
jgi:putative phosphoesterase